MKNHPEKNSPTHRFQRHVRRRNYHRFRDQGQGQTPPDPGHPTQPAKKPGGYCPVPHSHHHDQRQRRRVGHRRPLRRQGSGGRGQQQRQRQQDPDEGAGWRRQGGQQGQGGEAQGGEEGPDHQEARPAWRLQ